jgi:hypothetical protein
MTRYAPAILFFLAACGPAPADLVTDQRIECRVAGAATHERVCVLEASGQILTVRKPDGGFRRLRAGADGIAAADGAERARTITLGDGRVEIEIGGDRFRLPAGFGQ